MPVNQDALIRALGLLTDDDYESINTTGDGSEVRNQDMSNGAYAAPLDWLNNLVGPSYTGDHYTQKQQDDAMTALGIAGAALGLKHLPVDGPGPKNALDRIITNSDPDFNMFTSDFPEPQKGYGSSYIFGTSTSDKDRQYLTSLAIKDQKRGIPGLTAIDTDGNVRGAASYGTTGQGTQLKVGHLGSLEPGYGPELFDNLQRKAQDFAIEGVPASQEMKLQPLTDAIPFYRSRGMTGGDYMMYLDKEAPRRLLESDYNWFMNAKKD